MKYVYHISQLKLNICKNQNKKYILYIRDIKIDGISSEITYSISLLTKYEIYYIFSFFILSHIIFDQSNMNLIYLLIKIKLLYYIKSLN